MKVSTRHLTHWQQPAGLLEQVIALDQAHMAHAWGHQEWVSCRPESYRLYVLLQEERCLGFALYLAVPAEELAHLVKLVVTPEHRGKGVSQIFWQEQVQLLRIAKFRQIYLEVAESNERAQAFYTKCGFLLLRRVAGFYQSGEAALTMALAI